MGEESGNAIDNDLAKQHSEEDRRHRQRHDAVEAKPRFRPVPTAHPRFLGGQPGGFGGDVDGVERGVSHTVPGISAPPAGR